MYSNFTIGSSLVWQWDVIQRTEELPQQLDGDCVDGENPLRLSKYGLKMMP